MINHGITHVVNCVGQAYPNYFENNGIKYLRLGLSDSVEQDLDGVLQEVLKFIELSTEES